jgi:NADH-quinone oxidoreductase subunit L
MPVTHLGFLIACLAISGIPPFAGFFSKEAILHAAYQSNPAIYYVALFTSFLTSFYMFRLYFSIFWSTQKAAPDNAHGEGTWSMKIPLILLAIASVLFGFIPFSEYVSTDGKPIATHLDVLFSIAPVTLGVLGILLAKQLYQKASVKPQKIALALGSAYGFVKNKFYIDEVYQYITKKMLFAWVARPAAWIDKNIIDGFYLLLAQLTQFSSVYIKGIQSGKVQAYAMYFFAGILSLASLLFYVLK